MRNNYSEEDSTLLDPHRTSLIAYEFWRARGCPEGSPDEDWFLAEEQLRHQQNFSLQEAA
jgi:Protein of unknown function (DUF2934)